MITANVSQFVTLIDFDIHRGRIAQIGDFYRVLLNFAAKSKIAKA